MCAQLQPGTSEPFTHAHGPHGTPRPRGHKHTGDTWVAHPKRGRDRDEGLGEAEPNCGCWGDTESRPWSQAGISGIATAPPVVSHHSPWQLVTPRIKQAARCQALPESQGDPHTPRERRAGLRTTQLSARTAADPAQGALGATGLPQPQGLGTGTAAELSHGDGAQARLGYGQGLPAGSPGPPLSHSHRAPRWGQGAQRWSHEPCAPGGHHPQNGDSTAEHNHPQHKPIRCNR